MKSVSNQWIIFCVVEIIMLGDFPVLPSTLQRLTMERNKCSLTIK
jgi:hypothetical protein